MKLKYEFQIQEIDDSYCAVAMEESCDFNGVVRLNQTGKKVFELLQKETSEEAIVAELAAVYEEETDVLAAEVSRFLKTLRENGMLVEENE